MGDGCCPGRPRKKWPSDCVMEDIKLMGASR